MNGFWAAAKPFAIVEAGFGDDKHKFGSLRFPGGDALSGGSPLGGACYDA